MSERMVWAESYVNEKYEVFRGIPLTVFPLMMSAPSWGCYRVRYPSVIGYTEERSTTRGSVSTLSPKVRLAFVLSY